jgi:hypothetical protein
MKLLAAVANNYAILRHDRLCCRSAATLKASAIPHIDGMTRTQIQLPDETYARAQKLCEAREMPLAELARRGIEYILSVYAPDPDANRDWQPPKPRNLGWKGLSHTEIKAEAQLTNPELRLNRRKK